MTTQPENPDSDDALEVPPPVAPAYSTQPPGGIPDADDDE